MTTDCDAAWTDGWRWHSAGMQGTKPQTYRFVSCTLITV